MKIKWQKEVRTEFEDANQAAPSAQEGAPGSYALTALQGELEKYEFPLFLTAEWGQPDRLLKVMDSPGTSQLRKLKIISLLGEMVADEALPHLTEALKDKELAIFWSSAQPAPEKHSWLKPWPSSLTCRSPLRMPPRSQKQAMSVKTLRTLS